MLPLYATLEQLHSAVVAEIPANIATELLKPHPRLTPIERIAIYQEAYRLRLQSAVRDDYPATLHHLGVNAEPLIAAYVNQTPSDSYNLDRYSLGFARFLATSLTGATADLAALEAAVTEAFMFQDQAALKGTVLADMDEEALGSSYLKLQQSARLLHLQYDVESYYAAYKDGTPPETIEAHEIWLLLFRKNRSVRRFKICEQEYALLQAIQSGENFNVAVELALQISNSEDTIISNIGTWLTGWFENGLISSIS